MSSDQVRPLWFRLLVVAACLPVLAYPWMLGRSGEGDGLFLTIYPFYVLVSAVCAWRSYPSNKDVSWILLVLLLLTHAAMWVLVLQ